MFQLRGSRPEGDEAPPAESAEEVIGILDSAPLTDYHVKSDFEWDATLNRGRRVEMPTFWFEYGDELRDYLVVAENFCYTSLSESHNGHVPDELVTYLKIVDHYDQAEMFLERFLAHSQVTVEDVGVLDIREMQGPPFLAPRREGTAMLVPGVGYRINTLVDFGETERPLLGTQPMKVYHRYPFRLSLAWDSAVLRLGCVIVDELAMAAYHFGETSTSGTFAPILDPAEYRIENTVTKVDGDRPSFRIPGVLGEPGQELLEFLLPIVHEDLHSVMFALELRMLRMELDESTLTRFLHAARLFEDWVRGPSQRAYAERQGREGAHP